MQVISKMMYMFLLAVPAVYALQLTEGKQDWDSSSVRHSAFALKAVVSGTLVAVAGGMLLSVGRSLRSVKSQDLTWCACLHHKQRSMSCAALVLHICDRAPPRFTRCEPAVHASITRRSHKADAQTATDRDEAQKKSN